MKVLELFSGTGSVSKICEELGWEKVSVDLQNADINIDILEWDFKSQFKEGDFDLIWASPPCCSFSNMLSCWIGRKLNGEIVTKESIEENEKKIGLPLLYKTIYIINYLKPKYWFIENPASSRMKKYLEFNNYVVDYCRYSNWGYKKPTRIWVSDDYYENSGFIPLTCQNKCKNRINDTSQHLRNLGNGDSIKRCREFAKEKNVKYIHPSVNDKYRIPPDLIKDLFSKCL
jgi:site-specific DNA-cytosine methylase